MHNMHSAVLRMGNEVKVQQGKIPSEDDAPPVGT
jgi:hypothetical protein